MTDNTNSSLKIIEIFFPRDLSFGTLTTFKRIYSLLF